MKEILRPKVISKSIGTNKKELDDQYHFLVKMKKL